MEFTEKEISPLASIEEWEEDLLVRYPEPKNLEKTKQQYRNYDDSERVNTVREFYRLNHTYQMLTPIHSIEFQNDYAQGIGGVYQKSSESSWGPKMTSSTSESR